MNLTYKTSKIGLLVAIIGFLALSSCKKNIPEALDTSANVTALKTIKIVNAGANGNIVMQGTIDEEAKTVSFSRIDTLTNFANLKFEASLSDGAKLSQDTYSLTFDKGQSEQVVALKVLNAPRYREYLVKLRLNVAVFGADFEKGTTYDFTTNPLGNPIYDAFTGALTRGSGFDGDKVLIVRRDGPHLLNVSELKTGVINKIMLNMTGVSGGTYTINMGAQVNGHTFIANLCSNAPTNPLKIYHWTSPSATPQVIANINLAPLVGIGLRYGDNFSASLDDQGNGYFFLGDNAGTNVLRLSVANYTTVTNPTVFAVPLSAPGSWISYNRIGNTSEYLFTGHQAAVALVSEGGASNYTTTNAGIPVRASDARVVYFNGERYLIVTTAARTGQEATNFIVYNITKGATVKEALMNLDTQPTITPVLNYSLMGPVNGSPASQTGFYVKKDGAGKDVSLMLYSGASDAGFVFFEFPKKVNTD